MLTSRFAFLAGRVLVRSARVPAAAASLACMPPLWVKTAVGLSFGAASAAIAQCAGSSAVEVQLAEKLRAIDEARAEIARREAQAQAARQRTEQRAQLEAEQAMSDKESEEDEEGEEGEDGESDEDEEAARAVVEFVEGQRVSSDLLGGGRLKKGPRAQDGKVLFEWTRPKKKGRGVKKGDVLTLNRWIFTEGLTLLEDVVPPGAVAQQAAPTEEQEQPATPSGSSTTNNRGTPTLSAAEQEEMDWLGPRPELAAHERDRVLIQKRPAGQRLGVAKTHKSATSKVSAKDRCAEFNQPDFQSLRESLGSVYCCACKTTLFNKHSTIKKHLNAPTHAKKLIALTACRSTDRDIAAECETTAHRPAHRPAHRSTPRLVIHSSSFVALCLLQPCPIL